MNYVDGYLLAVPAVNRAKYLKMADLAALIFKECGALRVVESWEDDVPEGKLTSFPMAVKREPGEAVVFSWVEWASRAARDEGMKKFMADTRLSPGEMAFDGKRMIFGGFQAVVDA